MNVIDKTLFFVGRFKTVKQKQVNYTGESKGIVMNNSFPEDRGTPPAILPTFALGATAGLSLIPAVFPVGPHPLSAFVFSAPALGLPAASWGAAHLMDRKVNYIEKQVPMTEAEELAMMTPIEKAHWEIDQALKKWQTIRQKQGANLKMLDDQKVLLEKDITRLEASLQNSNSFEREQFTLQLAAKQESLNEMKGLAELSIKMKETMEAKIKLKEASLYAAKEKLAMMTVRQEVLNMHQQLQGMNQEDGQADAMHPVLLDVEKQKVQLEGIMASIKTAMDVDAVLKSVSQEG
jgi:hypothetical protein